MQRTLFPGPSPLRDGLFHSARLPQVCGGLALFGTVLMSLPLSTHHLAQLQALNRELGKLCSNPPRQALNVCRLHARLLSTL
jgi:hypothetical protein